MPPGLRCRVTEEPLQPEEEWLHPIDSKRRRGGGEHDACERAAPVIRWQDHWDRRIPNNISQEKKDECGTEMYRGRSWVEERKDERGRKTIWEASSLLPLLHASERVSSEEGPLWPEIEGAFGVKGLKETIKSWKQEGETEAEGEESRRGEDGAEFQRRRRIAEHNDDNNLHLHKWYCYGNNQEKETSKSERSRISSEQLVFEKLHFCTGPWAESRRRCSRIYGGLVIPSRSMAPSGISSTNLHSRVGRCADGVIVGQKERREEEVLSSGNALLHTTQMLPLALLCAQSRHFYKQTSPPQEHNAERTVPPVAIHVNQHQGLVAVATGGPLCENWFLQGV
ncbi:hypothetical protein EYF80_009774 [Liparis tanakae]|uniref:Uncharacterized protein n=1 Tax=Liparis tanakae TaxID=230148 RepID=A0A4Z2IQ93_9TELE|nr:hypothetical protein EYF80_009774 [Liparis tanakae]